MEYCLRLTKMCPRSCRGCQRAGADKVLSISACGAPAQNMTVCAQDNNLSPQGNYHVLTKVFSYSFTLTFLSFGSGVRDIFIVHVDQQSVPLNAMCRQT